MSDEQNENFQKLLDQFEKIVKDTDRKIDINDDTQKKYLLKIVPEVCQFARAHSFSSDFNAASLLMMCAGYMFFDLVSRTDGKVKERRFTDEQITQLLQVMSFADLEQLLSSAGLIYWYYANSRR